MFAQGPAGRFGPMGRGWVGRASQTPVTGAPYSGLQTVSSQQVLANGNQISHTQQSKVYRDSQGRTRTEQTVTPPASSGKQPYTQVTIVDPVAGYRYMLNSSTLTAIQMPLPAPKTSPSTGTPTPRPRPSGVQVTTTSLSSQTINGVLATGTQTTQTIPAGTIGNAQAIQIVRTTWISTALQVPVEIKTSDPRSGTTDMEVTGIVQTEPDESLFKVPSNYTIKTGGPGMGGPGMGGAMGGPGPGAMMMRERMRQGQ
jgi:hypothetical protein